MQFRLVLGSISFDVELKPRLRDLGSISFDVKLKLRDALPKHVRSYMFVWHLPYHAWRLLTSPRAFRPPIAASFVPNLEVRYHTVRR